MKQFFITICFLAIAVAGMAQFKPHLEKLENKKNPAVTSGSLQLTKTFEPISRLARDISPNSISSSSHTLAHLATGVKVLRDQRGMPIFIEGTPRNIEYTNKTSSKTIEEQVFDYLSALQETLRIKEPKEEFKIIDKHEDKLGNTHIRLQQVFQSTKVFGGEIVLHLKEDKVYLMNGNYYPTPALENIIPSIQESRAIEIVKAAIAKETNIKFLSEMELQLLRHEPLKIEPVTYHRNRDIEAEQLAWAVDFVPNLAHHFTVIIDAQTGTILDQYNQICHLHSHETGEELLDGPAVAQAVDLKGVTRTINTYEVGGDYFLIDATKTMFNLSRSQMPNNPAGAIWTIDGQNGSPQSDNFEIIQNFSPNNNWNNNPTAVSAHYNAEVAYEYFRNTFNRNSIDGQGGTIVSIINITDEDGQSFGNAFWSGTAMFYGNGDNAFEPLAGGLDVAAHEMSHGVIQNTSNLIYQGESGALNESFADVFGVLVDRDDWLIGEEVVKRGVFRSGALRNMQDPNNGGRSLNDIGWQPASVNEQYFGQEDNGGVHINSGITNRAFYLIASNIGLEKAEQIYYRALTTYLTRSAQFVDARLSIVQSAKDLHGENSNEVSIANQAFDAVGIILQDNGGNTGGGGNNQTSTVDCDIDVNPGEEFIVLTDANNSALYVASPNGEILQNPLLNEAILSKPSASDDGSLIVWVSADKTIKYFDFNTNTSQVVQNQPIWRNVAVSKDGLRLAAIGSDLNTGEELVPQIVIFNLVSGEGVIYELARTTTAQGIATGEIEYADALEWDYDGESLYFDSFNSIQSSFGNDIEFWDISIMNAWNNETNDFGSGGVIPLFPNIAENISIGNPVLAKNSPCVMAFDYLESDEFGQISYAILGYNFEEGDIQLIKETSDIAYPNYSVQDDAILYDDYDFFGNVTLSVQPLGSDKIRPTGQSRGLIQGGSKGVWIGTGQRVLTSTKTTDVNEINIYPTLAKDELTINLPDNVHQSTLRIFDLLGRMVQSQSLTGTTSVAITNLSNGTYFLQLEINGEITTKKIVKQ